jgi:AcrR family transcriptional regulator
MASQLSDPRIRRSRSALEAALRELIAERELGQISVSDLTKRAGVDRSTFYEHYTDVGDLAAAACTSLFDEVVAALPAPADRRANNEEPVSGLIRVFAHVAEHATLYRALLGEHGSARVISHLFQRFASAVHAGLHSAADAHPAFHGQDVAEQLPPDPLAVFMAGALLGTIMDWLRRGCPGTPEQIAAAVWPYVKASAEARRPAVAPIPGP